MHRLTWNAAMNAECKVDKKHSSLFLSPFGALIVRNCSQTIKDGFIHFTKLLQRSVAFHPPFFHTVVLPFQHPLPIRILLMLISSVDCSSRYCLLGEYLKNIARLCRVDVTFCTPGTLHALDSTRFSGNNVFSA